MCSGNRATAENPKPLLLSNYYSPRPRAPPRVPFAAFSPFYNVNNWDKFLSLSPSLPLSLQQITTNNFFAFDLLIHALRSKTIFTLSTKPLFILPRCVFLQILFLTLPKFSVSLFYYYILFIIHLSFYFLPIFSALFFSADLFINIFVRSFSFSSVVMLISVILYSFIFVYRSCFLFW